MLRLGSLYTTVVLLPLSIIDKSAFELRMKNVRSLILHRICCISKMIYIDAYDILVYLLLSEGMPLAYASSMLTAHKHVYFIQNHD